MRPTLVLTNSSAGNKILQIKPDNPDLVPLGASGLLVSPIGLGCMGMSTAYGPADDTASVATIHRAIDLGVNFFDTADLYGAGCNERLVGAAVREKRSAVILATKFGHVWQGEATGTICGRPAYVRQSCENSLRRLNTEYIDIYYQHRVDTDTPIEDTVGEMARLVEEGKVRHLGLSEASAATLATAHSVHPIAALQSEYSLWSRDVEDKILPACEQLGIGFVAYCPLGRGFLSGRIQTLEGLQDDDWRRGRPRFMGANLQRNQDLLKTLGAIALNLQCTMAQVSLAWLLHRKSKPIPIPGTKRRKYLEENWQARSVTLAATDLAALDHAFQTDNISGERYGAPDLMRTNR
jgi:aryl-alcohol dehydrogenase-like predicted oxidoreductase